MGSNTSRDSPREEQELYAPIPAPIISDGVAFRTNYVVLQAPTVRLVPEPPKDVPLSKMTLPVMIDKNTVSVRRLTSTDISVRAVYHARKDVHINIAVCEEDDTVINTVEFSASVPEAGILESKRELHHRVSIPSGYAMVSNLKIRITITQDKCYIRTGIFLRGDIQKIDEFIYTDDAYTQGLDLLPLYVTRPQESRSSDADQNGYIETVCSICLLNRANVGFLPCRHVCVCSDCSSITLSSSENHCPMCRQNVTGRISLE